MASRRSNILAAATFLVTAAFLFILLQAHWESNSVRLPFAGRGPVCEFRKHSENHNVTKTRRLGGGDGSNMPLTAPSTFSHNASRPKQSPLFAPPLRTKGRNIVDANDKRFKLASINWYGASDVLFIPGGLDKQHRSSIAATIRRMGFNSVRLPYSDEMVLCNPKIGSHLIPANPDLYGMRAMDVFQAVVEALTDQGIAVIVNNHITHAGWFDGFSLCDATWSNTHLGPLCRISQSEESWIENWEELMSRFVSNPLVIGADLRNEIHGFWGTMPWSSWAPAAERASERLLLMQPDWLMFIEGTESANDISGALNRPIRLSIPDRVVYSSHVYSWSGWGEMDPFSKRSYPSFAERMRKNWAYLLDQDIAPVWVGEFGAPYKPDEGNLHYWKNLMRYLDAVDADFGYWALNPRKPSDDSRESYSIIQYDWVSELNQDYRMRDMRELMKDKKDRVPTWEWTGKPDVSNSTG